MRTVAGPSSAVQCELTGGPYTVWSRCAACPGGVPAAQRKLLLEANRRPPSLVDVSRGRHRGPGRRRGDSGPACASVSCAAVAVYAAVAAPGPCPGGRSGV